MIQQPFKLLFLRKNPKRRMLFSIRKKIFTNSRKTGNYYVNTLKWIIIWLICTNYCTKWRHNWRENPHSKWSVHQSVSEFPFRGVYYPLHQVTSIGTWVDFLSKASSDITCELTTVVSNISPLKIYNLNHIYTIGF